MSEHEFSPDRRPPDDPKGAVVGALSSRFPQLQSLLSVSPCLAGDLLPYLLLAELYHWSADHKATPSENDAETQAVIQLCGTLFARPAGHDEPETAVTVEIIESLLAARRAGS
jgi:hypothetical protein